MNTKLLAVAMATGLGLALNGAYGQSVELQGPQLVQQETKSFQAAQSSEGKSDWQQLVQGGGGMYEGYTRPGMTDDILLLVRIEPTLVLRHDALMQQGEEAVAEGPDNSMSGTAAE
jgi:hypothetical protein